MKKITLNILATVVLAASITITASAQNKHPDNSGKLQTIGLGVGFGSNYDNIAYDTQTPMINGLYEHEVYRFDNIGIITAGGQLGFRTYKNSEPGYDQKWFWVIVSARGLFHVTALKVENLDVYGGIAATYYFLDYSDNFNSNQTYNNHFGLGAFAGARYYFGDKFSAFGELGFGSSFFNTGVSYKL